MLEVKIPSNNINERIYILDIIINEFLGLEYNLIISEENFKYWEFVGSTGKKLLFEDHFFNSYKKDFEYLKFENIPTRIIYQNKNENKYIVENDIPIIYGKNKLKENEKKIICGIDIFSSSFFMISRWEEYVNKNRDSHNRFSSLDSLSYKFDFLDRPIVNEYVEMFKNMLLKLDINEDFKPRKYSLLLTHDVDITLKYSSFKSDIKEVLIDIVKRKNLKLAFNNIFSKIKISLGLQQDPYDTFDYLMNISDKVNAKSHFFFMGKGLTKYDNLYKSDDSFINNLIKKIKERKHCIGIHPSYNAYNDSKQFVREKVELEKNLDITLSFGREHYLNFEIPTTWQIWEDNNMLWDSTLSFADKEGFRCGVCFEYSVFNILTRKKLKLKEKPLIVMEASFITYQPDISPLDMESKILNLINKVKKYKGEFVFLWHNNNFNVSKWEKYKYIYEKVLRSSKEEKL